MFQNVAKAILISLVLINTFIFMISSAQSEIMKFKFVEPKFPKIVGSAWIIYAEGELDIDAPSRLEQLMRQRRVTTQYSTVFLNSIGGSLVAGIKMGQMFRKYGLSTQVGKYGKNGNPSFEGSLCLSACTLAYVGGKFRYLDKNSIFGVHRFYSNDRDGIDGDLAQIISANRECFYRGVRVST